MKWFNRSGASSLHSSSLQMDNSTLMPESTLMHGDSGMPTVVHNALAPARARWQALAERERLLLAVGGSVLGLYLLWAVALAPAWRTVRQAPAQIETLERQLQRMQGLANEAKALRAVAPVPLAEAQAALGAATQRLGPQAKLSLQGERAVLTLKGTDAARLGAWLAEARAGARARVVEANLNQASPGLYDGSLTLALGGGRR